MHSEHNWLAAPVTEIIHPASILRARPHGGYEFRNAVDALTKALAEYLTKTE